MSYSDTIPDDAVPIFEEIEAQNDRSAAIVAVSFVETALRATIETEWGIQSETARERLFKGSGPLATFSAKIEIGSAAGILGPRTRGDLNLIRKVRNEFAHFLKPIAFTTPHVMLLCEKMQKSSTRLAPAGIEATRYRFIEACRTYVFLFSIIVEELGGPSRDKSAPRPPLPILP